MGSIFTAVPTATLNIHIDKVFARPALGQRSIYGTLILWGKNIPLLTSFT
ncbi:MAG: hypothetical protein ACI8PP_000646 [Candidatus Pseudothioglobus sp.]|jgi:hypothetical protein